MFTLSLSAFAAAIATPARAHVTLEQQEATVGKSYKAVLVVPHGCNGSATTSITVRIPEGVIAVKPMPKPGWTVEIAKAKYDKAYTFMHGIKLSEGVREITWKGKLDGAHFDEFAFLGFLADVLPAGSTLYFPVVQECERGAERWIEIPEAGQSSHDLKSPAPALHLAAAKGVPATTFRIGSIVVASPYLRATPPGAQVAGGYMTLTNTGSTTDRLTGGTLDQVRRLEIHEMTMTDNVMRMRAMPNGIEIRPGETIELKSGGYHIMGMELQGSFTEGQIVKGTLQFEKAGTLDIEYAVRPIGGGGHRH
ncbi:MAG: DUF1775 domain-containing protein [Xanthobacteraceae bacterium]|nr:MAG: DUF1775 domain-containing protein [Xanthobacteraceae bacterium]